MPLRFVLLCALLSAGCGPALTIRRFASPTVALAARTVHLKVTSHAQSDAVDGEKVTDWVSQKFQERLELAGYAVCTPAPCGEGTLDLVIDEGAFDMVRQPETAESLAMKAQLTSAMAAHGFGGGTWTGANDVVKAKLKISVSLTLPDRSTRFKRSLSNQLDERGKSAREVMHAQIDALARDCLEPLRRNVPLRMEPLEGGGPLNRGVELLHARDFAAAVTYFTELTHAQPELDGAFYDLGFALELQNDWRPALAAYQEAARRAPQKPHYGKAVTAAQKALQGGD